MYCEHCGAFLPDGDRFCTNCGEPAPVMTENENHTYGKKAGQMEFLKKANSIAEHLVPGKLRSVFPNAIPIVIVGAYLVIFITIVSAFGIWTFGRHDLSGTYWTNEFFIFDQITFDKRGNFSAINYDEFDGSSETFIGKYHKQMAGEYSCRFTGGTASSSDPIAVFDAANMGSQCELAVKKIDENTLQVWIIPKISYWAWYGESVYFYR